MKKSSFPLRGQRPGPERPQGGDSPSGSRRRIKRVISDPYKVLFRLLFTEETNSPVMARTCGSTARAAEYKYLRSLVRTRKSSMAPAIIRSKSLECRYVALSYFPNIDGNTMKTKKKNAGNEIYFTSLRTIRTSLKNNLKRKPTPFHNYNNLKLIFK